MIKVSYHRLFKLLVDRQVTVADLRKETGYRQVLLQSRELCGIA